jgi:hypothetical protein
MDNDQQLIAVLLTEEEIYRLMSMCHDSNMYWHNHWQKAVNDSNYYLSKTGCEAVKLYNKKVADKIEAIYSALKVKAKEEAAQLREEEQEIDSSLQVA